MAQSFIEEMDAWRQFVPIMVVLAKPSRVNSDNAHFAPSNVAINSISALRRLNPATWRVGCVPIRVILESGMELLANGIAVLSRIESLPMRFQDRVSLEIRQPCSLDVVISWNSRKSCPPITVRRAHPEAAPTSTRKTRRIPYWRLCSRDRPSRKQDQG